MINIGDYVFVRENHWFYKNKPSIPIVRIHKVNRISDSKISTVYYGLDDVTACLMVFNKETLKSDFAIQESPNKPFKPIHEVDISEYAQYQTALAEIMLDLDLEMQYNTVMKTLTQGKVGGYKFNDAQMNFMLNVIKSYYGQVN